MREVKLALVAKIEADTGAGSLTELLNDGVGGIRFYVRGAETDEEYPTLTYFLVGGTEAAGQPKYDQTYQFDVWSRDDGVADAIAARLRRVLHKQPLTATGVRVMSCLKTLEHDDIEYDPTPLYHGVIQFRIISFANDGFEPGN